MKTNTGYHTYYINDWICQTPAIAIGKGESLLTMTYILVGSRTIEFNWE